MPEPHEDDGHLDGCACGADLSDDEATSDEDLPEARGGVERLPDIAADDLDGCGFEISDDEAIPNEDLPPAEGGVA